MASGRDPSGLQAVLPWLNILVFRRRSVAMLAAEHPATYSHASCTGYVAPNVMP